MEYVIYVSGDSLTIERPQADNVYVIHWEMAGIIIPWPSGLTIKQAIIDWAINQRAG